MPSIRFSDYNAKHYRECLELFDENCPRYFAVNEKEDYIEFLKSEPSSYLVGSVGSLLVSAFGLTPEPTTPRGRLTWILVHPKSKGNGIGAQMMSIVKNVASEKNFTAIDIAASHLSAPFFKKYGAVELNKILNGWGENMHRIDMEIKL